ncbi:unnamed protein product [Mytilus edulis]|uniref:Endonuclease/exonuclease/phosphatase domain-containing protein n=1 Tax=Mytilus edulis TaxID=6550 RepID=A0A8S3VG84_MYTED|nr:unnamed protein product [Mytilus edulis]
MLNFDLRLKYLLCKQDCLDIIHSIIEKYQSTHQVVVCGDLNGTLATSRNNKHDQLLKQFVLEMNLSTVGNYGEQKTFFHHSGQSSSQIDYILTNNKDIYCNHEIWENTSSNVSSHVPVSMITNIAVPLLEKFSNQNKKTVQRLKWNEIDEQLYRDTISEKLSGIREDKTTSENIKTLTSILLKASHLAVPSKTTKLKGPKWKASPKVRKHLKTCKQLYSKWKALGKPENHQSKQDLKSEKKKLRSQQRQEQATDRRKLYEQIMDNPSSELFFKLINRNKSKSKTETSGLEIDEIGTVHPVWESASQSLLDVRKSMIKARMLTGTYLVQADKYKFSQYKINATCLLCQREDEDLTHVLTFCPALREIRMKYFLPLKILVTNIIGCKGWEQLFNNNQNIVALLLDFSVFHNLQNLSKTQKMNVESLTRDFCYKIHICRLKLLKNLENQ